MSVKLWDVTQCAIGGPDGIHWAINRCVLLLCSILSLFTNATKPSYFVNCFVPLSFRFKFVHQEKCNIFQLCLHIASVLL